MMLPVGGVLCSPEEAAPGLLQESGWHVHGNDPVTLNQGFSSRGSFAPKKLWQCLEACLAITEGRGAAALGGWKPDMQASTLHASGMQRTTWHKTSVGQMVRNPVLDTEGLFCVDVFPGQVSTLCPLSILDLSLTAPLQLPARDDH